MTLVSGTRLGPYEIVAPIGAGGMGEVYQVRDTKLSRTVALKILPAAFANDSDRLARFKREALVLASLNHPNIAAIYGLEDFVRRKLRRQPLCRDPDDAAEGRCAAADTPHARIQFLR